MVRPKAKLKVANVETVIFVLRSLPIKYWAVSSIMRRARLVRNKEPGPEAERRMKFTSHGERISSHGKQRLGK